MKTQVTSIAQTTHCSLASPRSALLVALICSVLPILSGICRAQDSFAFRAWQSRAGSELKARISSADPNQVNLVTAEGKQLRVPLQSLSDQDQEFLKRWVPKIGANWSNLMRINALSDEAISAGSDIKVVPTADAKILVLPEGKLKAAFSVRPLVPSSTYGGLELRVVSIREAGAISKTERSIPLKDDSEIGVEFLFEGNSKPPETPNAGSSVLNTFLSNLDQFPLGKTAGNIDVYFFIADKSGKCRSNILRVKGEVSP